jgi:hypothetical protein
VTRYANKVDFLEGNKIWWENQSDQWGFMFLFWVLRLDDSENQTIEMS